MGSSQSKQNRPSRYNARLHHRPKPVKHQPLQPRDFNTFLCAPGFGRTQVTDDALLRSWRATRCVNCDGKVTAARGHYYAIHNVHGCQAAYHDRCMREYLSQRFVDRFGRQTRPHCMKCTGTMNIRLAKSTRNNPIGFERF